MDVFLLITNFLASWRCGPGKVGCIAGTRVDATLFAIESKPESYITRDHHDPKVHASISHTELGATTCINVYALQTPPRCYSGIARLFRSFIGAFDVARRAPFV
jgi:hypothetical protein